MSLSVVFQPYRDLEAGDNQSLKIQVARPGIEPRSSCSASQELNHSATVAPWVIVGVDFICMGSIELRRTRGKRKNTK